MAKKESTTGTRRVRRGQGDGSIYQRKSDGRFMAAIDLGYGANGKRIRKTVSAATRAEVVRKLRALQQQMDAGVLPDAATTEEWLRYWITEIAPRTRRKGEVMRERTLIGYRSYIDTWLIPHLGKVRLQHLTPDHVRALYRAMRAAGRSETTIRQAHAILHRALKVALLEGRVVRNAADMQDAPSADSNPTPHLSPEHAARVMAATSGGRELVRAICALGLMLRQGEALGLQWSDFDAEAATLHVQRAVQRHKGKGLVVTGVKSKTSNRVLDLAPEYVAAFVGLQMMSGSEWVFPGIDSSKPTDPRVDHQWWKDLLTRADVPYVPLRGARPTGASIMLDQGVPMEVIAENLGHAKGSIKTAEEHYAHTTRRARKAALESVAKAITAG